MGSGCRTALARFNIDLLKAREAGEQLKTPPPTWSCISSRGRCWKSMDLPLGVVLGTYGVERHRITWRGQAAHAGSTPMDKRRDALAGAAKLALEIRTIARNVGEGAVCTSRRGGVQAGDCDLRWWRRPSSCWISATSSAELAAHARWAKQASARFAEEEKDRRVEWERIWKIEPILFNPS